MSLSSNQLLHHLPQIVHCFHYPQNPPDNRSTAYPFFFIATHSTSIQHYSLSLQSCSVCRLLPLFWSTPFSVFVFSTGFMSRLKKPNTWKLSSATTGRVLIHVSKQINSTPTATCTPLLKACHRHRTTSTPTTIDNGIRQRRTLVLPSPLPTLMDFPTNDVLSVEP